MKRDDYTLRPSDCYDYKAMIRTNQQVNKIFDDLDKQQCASCHYSIDNVYCALHTIYDDDNEPLGQLPIKDGFSCTDWEKDKR